MRRCAAIAIQILYTSCRLSLEGYLTRDRSMHKLICVIIGVWVTFSADIAASAFAQESEPQTQEHSLDPNDPLSGLVADVDVFLEHLKHDRYAEAAAAFESLVAGHWNPSFQLLMERRTADATDLASRLKILQAAVAENQDDPVLHRLLGYVCLLKEKYHDSKDQFTQAIKLDPSNPVPYFLHGYCYHGQYFASYLLTPEFKHIHMKYKDETKEAIDDVSQALRLDPTNSRYLLWRARLRGCLLYDPTAVEDVDAALALNHDRCECLLLRGSIQIYLKEYQLAVDDLTSAITAYKNRYVNVNRYIDCTPLLPIDSDLVQSYIFRGQAKGHLNDYAGAIDDLNSASKIGRYLDFDFYQARANMYIATKDYPAALADLNKQEGIYPEYFERRAWVKLHLKDYQGALPDYDRALGTWTGTSAAFMGRGITKQHLRQYEGAIEDLDHAVSRSNLRDPDVYLARGMLRLELGDAGMARYDFDRVVKLNPKLASGYFQRGLAYHALQKYSDAIHDFDTVLQSEPENVAAHFNRGLSQRAAKDYSAAIASFDTVTNLNPAHLRGYHLRALTKFDARDYSGALADYDRALSINPKLIGIYLQRASANIRLENFQSAISDYDTAIQTALSTTSRTDGFHRIKAICGKSFLLSTSREESTRNPKEARSLADQALQIDPTSPEAMNARACADAIAGNFQSAITWEEKALANQRFASHTEPDGGRYAQARINAWKAGNHWAIPTEAKN